jgi:hypothetical protein
MIDNFLFHLLWGAFVFLSIVFIMSLIGFLNRKIPEQKPSFSFDNNMYDGRYMYFIFRNEDNNSIRIVRYDTCDAFINDNIEVIDSIQDINK